MTGKTKDVLPKYAIAFNGILLLITLILGFGTFISLTNSVGVIANIIATQSNPVPYQQSRIILNIRNFWMLLGGGIMVIFLAGNMEYHATRLGREKSRRNLMVILLIEVVICVVGYLI